MIGTFSVHVFFLFDASATVTDAVNLPAFVGTPLTLPLLYVRTFGSPVYSAEMQAWAARKSGDAAMARKIWKSLLALLWSEENPEGFRTVPYGRGQDGSPLVEIPWITTNFTAQWCLKAIVTAEFIPESRPETLAELNEWLRKDPPEYRMYGA